MIIKYFIHLKYQYFLHFVGAALRLLYLFSLIASKHLIYWRSKLSASIAHSADFNTSTWKCMSKGTSDLIFLHSFRWTLSVLLYTTFQISSLVDIFLAVAQAFDMIYYKHGCYFLINVCFIQGTFLRWWFFVSLCRISFILSFIEFFQYFICICTIGRCIHWCPYNHNLINWYGFMVPLILALIRL